MRVRSDREGVNQNFLGGIGEECKNWKMGVGSEGVEVGKKGFIREM